MTREEKRERNKKYYVGHREEARERNKKYRAEHREELIEYSKRYYAEHQEEFREYGKEYYVEHREEMVEKSRKVREKSRKVQIAKECIICGTLFTPIRKDSICCSNKCKNRNRESTKILSNPSGYRRRREKQVEKRRTEVQHLRELGIQGNSTQLYAMLPEIHRAARFVAQLLGEDE